MGHEGDRVATFDLELSLPGVTAEGVAELAALVPVAADEIASAGCPVRFLGATLPQRQLRVVNAQTPLSAPLWILFSAGGAVSIFYTYLFADARNSRFQALLVALLAGLFGFVLYLLFRAPVPVQRRPQRAAGGVQGPCRRVVRAG